MSFAPGAFTEALEGDREILALAGSNRPLASVRKGTLAIRETEGGNIEIELDRLSADTLIGRDLAGQAKATRVVMRPLGGRGRVGIHRDRHAPGIHAGRAPGRDRESDHG